MADQPAVKAVYDWGNWSAQCPCGNALTVALGQAALECRWVDRDGRVQGCGTVRAILWPRDPAAVVSQLAMLPPAQRHWEPDPDPLNSHDAAAVNAELQARGKLAPVPWQGKEAYEARAAGLQGGEHLDD